MSAHAAMKILLVSWYFPPVNDVGALRMSGMASYFQAAGHDVHVLTAARAHRDMSLATDLPAGNVVRTPWFDVDNFRFRRGRSEEMPPAPQDKAAAGPAKRHPVRTFLAEQYRHMLRMPD